MALSVEQEAVLAALVARRGPDVRAVEVGTADVTVIRADVIRADETVERYYIQPSGETRKLDGGVLVVPEHLYGTLPSETSRRRATWGHGFPERAKTILTRLQRARRS